MTVEVQMGNDTVVWSDVLSSQAGQNEPLASLGPFTFDRTPFMAALRLLPAS